ncbi:MAG TPA: NifU family protein [Acidimicrobiales bacterium]|jgi:Fe/S biogenesis protein NfuA
MADVTTEPVVVVTEAARRRILELRAAETDADTLGLRVEVIGASGADYTYDLAFEPVSEADPDDVVEDQGGLPVVVPASSVDKLRGATLDVPAGAEQGGLVLRNPNRPSPFTISGDVELTGELPDKVRQLLDEQVNPAIAAHGGYAELVGVDGTAVLVRMGGGCQGCAMSAMTLRMGIEAMIKEALPEVTEVVDVTDHASGDNPFYS